MKKRIIAVLGSVLIFIGILAGCTSMPDSEQGTYKVTFVQLGQSNVIKEVRYGEELSDIPVPKDKIGYTVVWDITDFQGITSDIIVTAIETANEYTIIYSLGELAGDANAKIELTTQTVTFDSPYNLCTPSCYGYTFIKWVRTGTDIEVKNGIWSIAESESLTAVWEIDKNSDRWWSDNF